jgi:replicative DNA helicase
VSGDRDGVRDDAAEAGYLAACFAEPDVLEVHPVPGAVFTLPLRQQIHATMLAARRAGQRVDHATITAALRAQGYLQSSGEPVYEIAASLVPWVDASRFAEVLLERHQARRDRDRSLRAAHHFALGDRARGVEMLVEIQDESARAAALSIRGIDDLVREESLRRICAEAPPKPEDAPPPLLVPYHHPALDRALNGKRPGDLVIVGADTNVGKTHFAIGEADAARAAGIVAGVVSCEDPEDVFASRELDKWHATGGMQPSGPQWWLATLAAPRLDEVVRAMTGLVSRHGAKFLVVDYVQAIEHDAENRRLALRDIANRLKGCAKRLGVPLMLLSQLTVERPWGGGKKGRDLEEEMLARGPSKNDLRDSRDLSHAAEVVITLWRAQDFDACPIRAKVAKSKRGSNGRRCWFSRGPGGALVPERDYPPPPESEEPPQRGGGYRVGKYAEGDRDAAE